MSKRILISGATSFIGRHLVKTLRGRGHEITGTYLNEARNYPLLDEDYRQTQLDLNKEAEVQHLLEVVRPELIYHLAGISTVKSEGPDMIQTNILGTYNLLRWAPHGCRVIFASSATIYGDYDYPTDEYTLPRPTSLYGITKLAGEELLKLFSGRGLSGLAVRLTANVGGMATHGVVPDLYRKLLTDDAQLEVLGARPGSSKPYLHVSDTVRFLAQYAPQGSTPGGFGVVNLSNDDVLTSEEIARLIMEMTGIDKTIRWNPAGNWVGDNKIVRVNANKSKNWGFYPKLNSLGAVKLAVQEMMEVRS